MNTSTSQQTRNRNPLAPLAADIDWRTAESISPGCRADWNEHVAPTLAQDEVSHVELQSILDERGNPRICASTRSGDRHHLLSYVPLYAADVGEPGGKWVDAGSYDVNLDSDFAEPVVALEDGAGPDEVFAAIAH